jgi:hypothetical protein
MATLTYDEAHRRAEAGDLAAQEALADALEQAGRPAEASPWLQRAAAGGRPSALAKLGLRRLVGFTVPTAPQAGVAEILQAARAGDPLGLSLAATVTAGGVGTPRDPAAALGWLSLASQRGDGRASAQLALMAGEPHRTPLLALAAAQGLEAAKALGAAGPPPTSLPYDSIVAGIDLSAFDTQLEPEVVCDAPRIVVLPNLLPDWACDYVMALSGPVLTRGKVLDETGGESVRAERTNTVMNFGLVDSDALLELINTRLAGAAGMPPEHAEGLGVLHYAPGEEYAPHVDYIPDTPANAAQLAQRGQRVRTLLVYLSEDFEGGATEFLRLDKACKPPRGAGLIFDNVTPAGEVDPMSLHRGAPPTAGQKWVISKWFRTRALRPGPGAP